MVDVRTNEYAIGSRWSESTTLLTENIRTCTGLVGIDEKSGVVFLCHLNTPRSASALPELVSELQQHVLDLSGFRLYLVGGMHPVWLWLAFILISGLFVYLGAQMGDVVGALLGFLVLPIPLIFRLTRSNLKPQLRRLNVFSGDPISLGYSSACFGLGMRGIRVDAVAGTIPEPESYCIGRNAKRFDPETVLRWTKMKKAPDSALPPR